MNGRLFSRWQIGLVGALLPLGAMLSGCASRSALGASDPVATVGDLNAYPASTLDKAPRLIGCGSTIAGPSPSMMSGVTYEYVRLRYVVRPDGLVDERTVSVTSSSGPRNQGTASSFAQKEAEQVALSCRYEPGELQNVPVAALVTRNFRVPKT